MKDGIDSEDVHLERPMSCDDFSSALSKQSWVADGRRDVDPTGRRHRLWDDGVPHTLNTLTFFELFALYPR
jgi:hypothetical protein